ncbi:hypothetical protein OKW43_005752 [Paraburkholderia sp. WC7.3g]|uniref:hypothetical protein n=1 Tax=Paraburkholderia sp. WC7.3g TaxID=2991070 RepID=UPI003D1BA22F
MDFISDLLKRLVVNGAYANQGAQLDLLFKHCAFELRDCDTLVQPARLEVHQRRECHIAPNMGAARLFRRLFKRRFH